MKRPMTILLSVVFMIAGVGTAFMDFSPPGNKTMTAATIPQSPQKLEWNTNKVPLDLQLDLDKRLSREAPTVDTVRINDTVYVDKIKWKTRYKTVAACTAAREVGTHLACITPDTLPNGPTINSTRIREEQLRDSVGCSKQPTIQLTVDGVIVYQSEDEIHSGVEGQ